MRALIQRVQSASVSVAGERIAMIDGGLLVLLCVMQGDTPADGAWMVDKVANLRIFADAVGKMNCSVLEVHGAVLLVSQFTLAADCRKGRRPNFVDAAPPDQAERDLATVADLFRGAGISVQTGQFAAHMQVSLVNDGPVTIWLDSRLASHI